MVHKQMWSLLSWCLWSLGKDRYWQTQLCDNYSKGHREGEAHGFPRTLQGSFDLVGGVRGTVSEDKQVVGAMTLRLGKNR